MSREKNIQKPKIIVILGPTGSGKTGLGITLARKYKGEIVSADSRQVYQGMDIGTGKDLEDYTANGDAVPYHLIDVVKPNQRYDLASYKKEAEIAIKDILSRHKLPIVVGGSGLYLEALISNYQLSSIKANNSLRLELEQKNLAELFNIITELNPGFASKINNSDRNNKRRLIRYIEVFSHGPQAITKAESLYHSLIIGLNWPKDEIANRIHRRLIDRLDKQNMVEEVNNLNRQGVSWQRLESFGLEYKFIAWYLQEKIDYDEMVIRLEKAICQFAKRQMTWFRRWEKPGIKIHWTNDFSEVDQLVANHLNR